MCVHACLNVYVCANVCVCIGLKLSQSGFSNQTQSSLIWPVSRASLLCRASVSASQEGNSKRVVTPTSIYVGSGDENP